MLNVGGRDFDIKCIWYGQESDCCKKKNESLIGLIIYSGMKLEVFLFLYLKSIPLQTPSLSFRMFVDRKSNIYVLKSVRKESLNENVVAQTWAHSYSVMCHKTRINLSVNGARDIKHYYRRQKLHFLDKITSYTFLEIQDALRFICRKSFEIVFI